MTLFFHSLLFAVLVATTTQAQDMRDLRPCIAAEQEIRPGETQWCGLQVSAGQFLHVVVMQHGVDLTATLFDPAGKKILERDSQFGSSGPEPLSSIVETSGLHRLHIQAANPKASGGRYSVVLKELRPATTGDADRVRAENLIEEGQRQHPRPAAAEKYQQALALWRATGQWHWEARTLLLLSHTDFALRRYDSVLDHLRQALPLLTKAADVDGESWGLNQTGVVHYVRGQYPEAAAHYERSIALAEKIGEPERIASPAANAGLAYYEMGDLSKAQSYLERALPLARAVGDSGTEASVINNTALVYGRQGDYQKQLEYLRLALELRRAQRNVSAEAVLLNNIATAYLDLGDLDRAFEYYQLSLPLRRKVGDPRGEAAVLNNLSRVYRARNDFENTFNSLQQALALVRKAGDQAREAVTLNNIADALFVFEKGDQEAVKFLMLALPLRRASKDALGEAVTLGQLGKVYARMGDREKSLAHFRQALEISRGIKDQSSEAVTLQLLAKLALRDGDLPEALRRSEEAIAIIESQRAKIVTSLRSSFLSTVQDVYHRHIEVLMRLHVSHPAAGHDRAALEVFERAVARGLIDALAETRANIRQGVDATLRQRELTLTRRIEAAAREAGTAASPSNSALDGLLTEYQELQAEIRAKSPGYAALVQAEPLRVSAIQNDVLDADSLLLEYALGEDRSYLWALTTERLTSFELPKGSVIEALVRQMVDAMAKQMPEHVYRNAGAALSKVLLDPVADQLRGKRLVIVAGGALQYLPFGALPAPGKTAPLIASNEIVTLPSASTLAILRRETRGRKPAPKAVAVFADPVFSSDDSRFTAAARNVAGVNANQRSAGEEPVETDWTRAAGRSRLSRLPFTRSEASSILSLVPPEQTLQAFDFDASRSTVLSGRLGEYRTVHIATHAFVNAARPELSGIVMSLVDRQGRSVDGFVRLHQIYNLRLPVELVVLSACQTALGREIKGEGLVGMTRGFMYAGAPRVVATLWAVDDLATASLMKFFYEGMLVKRLRPAAALRAAQEAMWRQPRWRSPYYWAAFTLQGEFK